MNKLFISLLLSISAALFLMACDDQPAASAPGLYVISYERCPDNRIIEDRFAVCDFFNMKIDTDGSLELTGKYCQQSTPCKDKLAQNTLPSGLLVDELVRIGKGAVMRINPFLVAESFQYMIAHSLFSLCNISNVSRW